MVLYTVYCILCTVHCVLYTVYCILCTLYCVLCICILYTVWCVLCPAYCTLCTVHCILYTVYCVYCVRYTVHCVLLTVCCEICGVRVFPFLSFCGRPVLSGHIQLLNHTRPLHAPFSGSRAVPLYPSLVVQGSGSLCPCSLTTPWLWHGGKHRGGHIRRILDISLVSSGQYQITPALGPDIVGCGPEAPGPDPLISEATPGAR